MRTALLADVHGNADALQAVLRDVEAQGPVDAILVLGDLVAFGPDAGGCRFTRRRVPYDASGVVARARASGHPALKSIERTFGSAGKGST